MDNSSEEGESEDGDENVEIVVPLGPRCPAPTEPSAMRTDRVAGVRRGSGVPAALFVRRAYRFVDGALIGEHNGMVRDFYRTRRNFACAQGRGHMPGGYVGRGYRLYR